LGAARDEEGLVGVGWAVLLVVEVGGEGVGWWWWMAIRDEGGSSRMIGDRVSH
jgi:hypothetical protein